MVTPHAFDVQRAAAPAVHQDGDPGQVSGGLAIVVPGNVEGRVAMNHRAGQLVVVAHIQGRIHGQRCKLGGHFSSEFQKKGEK